MEENNFHFFHAYINQKLLSLCTALPLPYNYAVLSTARSCLDWDSSSSDSVTPARKLHLSSYCDIIKAVLNYWIAYIQYSLRKWSHGSVQHTGSIVTLQQFNVFFPFSSFQSHLQMKGPRFSPVFVSSVFTKCRILLSPEFNKGIWDNATLKALYSCQR